MEMPVGGVIAPRSNRRPSHLLRRRLKPSTDDADWWTVTD
jgi:hypothetical protein